MSGAERHRRESHRHPARKPRDGRSAQRELKRALGSPVPESTGLAADRRARIDALLMAVHG